MALSLCLSNLSVPAVAGGPEAAANDAMRVHLERTGATYVVTVPASPLVLTLPPGAWQIDTDRSIGGDTASPRYFMLNDEPTHRHISGWIEPAQMYKGAKWRFDDILAGLKISTDKGWPAPTNVTYARVGEWDTMRYRLALGADTNLHLRANRVQSGTWVELHLSLSAPTEAEAQARLDAFLQGVKVTDRSAT